MSGSSTRRTGFRHPVLLGAALIGLSLPQTAFAAERARPAAEKQDARPVNGVREH